MNDTDIMARLNRILSAADERGLDETECRAIRDAAAEIGQLRQERDELRCEVCDWVGNHFKEPPQDVAKRNGWDCFDTGVWDCYKEKSND